MSAEHPDAAWVRATIADLTDWLTEAANEPTSQVTGGGAVCRSEATFARLHEGRPSVLVPSATYGMRAALLAAGVGPGRQVLVPGVDWGSTVAAVRSIGAIPVPVPVDATETLDPTAVAGRVTDLTAAAVVCHLHGVPADVPALRQALPEEVPIIEDCAQSLGSTLDGRPVGVFGDLAVFSFGPGKTIDVGEAAMVVARSDALRVRVIEQTAHPVRQLIAGVAQPALTGFSLRVAPVAAVRLAAALARWDGVVARRHHAALRALVEAQPGLAIVGGDARRQNASTRVPVRGGAGVGPLLVATPSAGLKVTRLLVGQVEACGVTLVGQCDLRKALRSTPGQDVSRAQ